MEKRDGNMGEKARYLEDRPCPNITHWEGRSEGAKYILEEIIKITSELKT